MKKRILVAILACVTVLGLVACGKGVSNSEEGKLTINESDIEAEDIVTVEDLSDTPVTGNYFGVYEDGGFNNIAFYISEDDQCVLTFSTGKYGTLTGDCDIYENYMEFGGKKCPYVMDTNGNLTFTYKDIAYGMTMIDEETFNKVLDGRETIILEAEPVVETETESTEESESTEEVETIEETTEVETTESETDAQAE